ncbi:MAG: hypothetical protein E6767_19060 [Dysgonomonas sp.]|nr:hypothetical protein [Dysgonomonas sp.]
MDELSIADLKAALDFVREDIDQMELKAHEEGIKPEVIPAYSEVRETEFKLHTRLLNITRRLS